MKKMKWNDRTINVPTSWADITLGEFEQWKLYDPNIKEEKWKHLGQICKLDVSKLMMIPKEMVIEIADSIAFTQNTNLEAQYSITLAGEKYFISSADKLTLGEWVDIDAILNNDNEKDKYAQLLSIVCRPVGESYNVETSAKRVDIFRQLTCDKALALVSFFLSRNESLVATLNHYLQVEAEASQFLKDTKTFAKSGIGTKRLPIWQRIKFYFLTKSLEKQLSKFSDLCSIN